jgi:hypothetical protein
MNSILLYEPDLIKVPHLKFLLELAHIHCISVHCFDEILNRLELDKYEAGCHDLIVLNSLDGLVTEDRLTTIIESTQVPLICMTPHNQIIQDGVKAAIEFCPHHIFLTCIQEKLRQQSKVLPNVSLCV